MRFIRQQKKRALPFMLALALAAALVAGWVAGCTKVGGLATDESLRQDGTGIALAWNAFYLELDRYAEGNRPPISARNLAYVGLAAYEAALPALEGYQSLAPLYPEIGLHSIRPPATFSLSAALNTTYATLFRHFFPASATRITQFENALAASYSDNNHDAVQAASAAYGKAVADSVFAWSATDLAGHGAHLHNFDPAYTPATGQGQWKPSIHHPMPPILPHWGKVRTFVLDTAALLCSPPLAFSEDAGSALYKEGLEVYSISHPLTDENRWIADFWSDDHSGLTFTPPARWISIANQVVIHEKPPTGKVLETYLKLGLALCDASVAAWHSKYFYNLERPETYVRRVIDPAWEPYHESPSFPSYPSGHATFGAAAATVLSGLYGDAYTFTDRSHERRTEFRGTPRTYRSFAEMASENAFSRIPYGAHFRMDCEEGIRLGERVGTAVNKLMLQQPPGLAEN